MGEVEEGEPEGSFLLSINLPMDRGCFDIVNPQKVG